MEHESEKMFKADLRMWILPLRLFDISWQELTAYCNKDIIELTYKRSLGALEFFSVEEKNIKRDVEKRFMNILVIGNGFDLAHGLPTKYGDFLEFVKVIRQVIRIYNDEDSLDIDWGNTNPQIKELMKKNMKKIQDNLFSKDKMWKELVDDNFWIEYFVQCNMFYGENWIDFEGEIKKIIKLLDSDMFEQESKYELDDKVNKSSSIFFKNIYVKRAIEMFVISTYRQIRDRLLSDLNNLIRALEIYLSDFVSNLECNIISPDIEEVMTYPFEYADGSTENKISYVISFNYTNTYKRIYFKEENIENYIHYIHGKADIDHKKKNNNMVLGIDEFLPNDRKDKDIEFIAFKKFYQRICKETGSQYKEWVDEIQNDFRINNNAENNCMEMVKCALRENDMDKALKWQKTAHENYTKKMKKHKLCIFGHSLDVTDKDILKELILNDNVDTTIFYRNQEQKEQQVANLVKVIGPDELIRRTGGSTKTIEFKLQQEMVERT